MRRDMVEVDAGTRMLTMLVVLHSLFWLDRGSALRQLQREIPLRRATG
jgi:hypothetical protein